MLFRKKLGHVAELVVTAVKELRHRMPLQLVKVLEKDFIYHGCCGVMVQVGSAVRLGNNLVNDGHFLQVRRSNAQRLGCNLLL